MTQENPPTILWVKFVYNGEIVEINSAEEDVDGIYYVGPGMYEIHKKQGIVDFIVSDNVWHRAKRDQTKIKVPELVVPS